MRLGITQRITLLWTVLFAVGLLAFALGSAAIVEREARESLDDDLTIRAQEALNRAQRGETVTVVGEAGVFVLLGAHVIRRGGVPPPAEMAALPAQALSNGATVHGYRAIGVTSGPYRAVAYAPDATLLAETQRIRYGFLLASLPVLALSALAGWLLARRSLRPVDDMTRSATSIAASGEMHGRLGLHSDDELGRLAATLDAMLERLEVSFDRERSFIGNVSHELRTAVGAMTAIGEATLGRVREPADYCAALESIVRRGKLLTSVIDDLLLLARADARVLQTTERADVNDIVAAVAADAQRRLSLTIDVYLHEESLFVAAAPALVTRALDNLVTNALKHSRARMSLSVERRGGSAIISVDDDGPGIPAGERADLFRRFYRGPSRYEGSGIGLALSAAVVRAYGGDIVIADSALGGARFEISMPLTA